MYIYLTVWQIAPFLKPFYTHGKIVFKLKIGGTRVAELES